jgi:sensor domain CHASE-containing protein
MRAGYVQICVLILFAALVIARIHFANHLLIWRLRRQQDQATHRNTVVAMHLSTPSMALFADASFFLVYICILPI